MSFLLIDYIKNKEETLEATEGGDTDNTPKRLMWLTGIWRSFSGEIESQEELVEHRQIVERWQVDLPGPGHRALDQH